MKVCIKTFTSSTNTYYIKCDQFHLNTLLHITTCNPTLINTLINKPHSITNIPGSHLDVRARKQMMNFFGYNLTNVQWEFTHTKKFIEILETVCDYTLLIREYEPCMIANVTFKQQQM